ncbi:CHAT domain-containing protein, partial [Mycena galopus ATCC 62051]
MSLNNLANVVLKRFEQQRDRRDLDEAIQLFRAALTFYELPHPDRGMYLNNLANAILEGFEQQGDTRSLNEAIQLHREALDLRDPPHPSRRQSLHNLANAVLTRFEHQRNTRDLDEAIELHSEALTLCESPHPDRRNSLNSLANAVLMRLQQQGDTMDVQKAIAFYHEALSLSHNSHDLESACHFFQEAATYHSSSPSTRLRYAWSWPCNQVTPSLAALHLDLPSRQEILSTVTETTLASNAAACAVGLSQYNTAVEMLEASRSIFWSQALHLQTPLDHLVTIHPGLFTKLEDLAAQLEQASFRDTSRNPSTDSQQKIRSIESDGAHCRQLNKDWETTVEEVRKLPGFEDFMQPKVIATLQQAAVSGPIVILTTTNSTCFALIVTFSTPVHMSELRARLFAGREGTIKVDLEEVFRGLLTELWNNIVKPVFHALGLQKSVDPPRLWWCPTGPFAFLPIHAAGIYDADMSDCVSDYVISSYTPTLTALLDPPPATAIQFKMTVVIEPKVPGFPPLPGARIELKKIMTRVPDQWLTGLVNSTVESALLHLRGIIVVHFACHGVQDLNHPLVVASSSLVWAPKVSDMMRRPEGATSLDPKKCMSLAFLSACETAKGDKKVPDEAMHFAATLLFAGFRGVVATM